MKAAYIETAGGPEVIQYGDLPDPAAGPGEVLIRVAATTVNHFDTVFRSGIRPYLTIKPPQVLGHEASGEIVAVGPGVAGWAVGDRVCTRTKTGSYAELAVAQASDLIKVPDNVSLEEAAGFGVTAGTAYRLVARRAELKTGEAVLITAGASGVGSLMVQIAKAAGYYVIATAGGARKRQLVSDLGADATIDHYEDDVAAKVMELTGGRGVDAAIDAVASQPLFEAVLKSLRPAGRLVVYGNMVSEHLTFHALTLFSKGLTIIGGQGGDAPQLAADRSLDRVAFMRLAARGQVKMLHDRVIPISQAAAAHAAMEAHEAAGKIVLTA